MGHVNRGWSEVTLGGAVTVCENTCHLAQSGPFQRKHVSFVEQFYKPRTQVVLLPQRQGEEEREKLCFSVTYPFHRRLWYPWEGVTCYSPTVLSLTLELWNAQKGVQTIPKGISQWVVFQGTTSSLFFWVCLDSTYTDLLAQWGDHHRRSKACPIPRNPITAHTLAL